MRALLSLCGVVFFALSGFNFFYHHSPTPPKMPAPVTARDTIDQFYHLYLSNWWHSNDHRPAFSQGFKADEAENKDVCNLYAGTDICGWDADTDPYINSQESDENLNYEHGVTSIKEPKPGIVEVRLNLFPSDPTPHTYPTIIYHMIQENNAWVVDNILYDNPGNVFDVRKEMRKETHSYQKSEKKKK